MEKDANLPKVQHILMRTGLAPSASVGINLTWLFFGIIKDPAKLYNEDTAMFGSGYVAVLFDGICRTGTIAAFNQHADLVCTPEDGWKYEETQNLMHAFNQPDTYDIKAIWANTKCHLNNGAIKNALTLRQLIITKKK